jgi:hypothetical protein
MEHHACDEGRDCSSRPAIRHPQLTPLCRDDTDSRDRKHSLTYHDPQLHAQRFTLFCEIRNHDVEVNGYIEVTPSLGAILETFVAIAVLVGLFAGRLYLGRLAAEWSAQLPPHLRGRWMQQAFD